MCSPEIVSSLQAKAYDGVEHSVAQKATELRGEAHRQSKPTMAQWQSAFLRKMKLGVRFPLVTKKQKTSPVTN